MKAVGYKKSLPIEDAESLVDFGTAKPEPQERDIRVAVKAVSVNPVDTKVRKRAEHDPSVAGLEAVERLKALSAIARAFAHHASLEILEHRATHRFEVGKGPANR